MDSVGNLADPWSNVDGWLDEIEPHVRMQNAEECKALMQLMEQEMFNPKEGFVGKLNSDFAKFRMDRGGVLDKASKEVPYPMHIR